MTRLPLLQNTAKSPTAVRQVLRAKTIFAAVLLVEQVIPHSLDPRMIFARTNLQETAQGVGSSIVGIFKNVRISQPQRSLLIRVLAEELQCGFHTLLRRFANRHRYRQQGMQNKGGVRLTGFQ